MASAGSKALLVATLLWSGFAPARGEDVASLCGGTGATVLITAAVDGHALRLADGRVIRLSRIVAPLPIDGDPDSLARTKEGLARLAAGKSATVHLLADAADRYGRLAASAVLMEDGSWLEAVLLAQGMARLVPSGNDECMTALLRHEAKARAAQAGIWAQDRFRIFDAGETDALLAAAGRFAIVEGTIRRVGRGRGRIYLDFGRRFTEDFTIIVPDSLRRTFEKMGKEPKNWRGRRIRVRGILFSWGGPAIEINLAQAIELLDSPTSE